jgi:phage terminase large subunit GpA-like protein
MIQAQQIESPLSAMLETLADGWAPIERVMRSKWCAENIKLPLESTAGTGRFDLDSHPWAAGILDAMDDPDVETITYIAGTQAGKTTTVHAGILSQAALSPSPMMFAGPDQDYVREQRDKIYETAEGSEALAGLIPPKNLRNDRALEFHRCKAYLAWSGSTQRLSGRAAKIVWCSEVDRWKQRPNEGKTAKIVAERVKAFYRWLILYEGTIIGEDSTLDFLYQQSNRCTFQVPCPRCNWFQELRFFPHRDGEFAGCGGIVGLHDDDGEWLPSDIARDRAYYSCERGCKIPNVPEIKAEMTRAGIWLPAGQSIGPGGEIIGKPERGPRNTGFRLSSLYAHTLDFGRIAAEYLDSRDEDELLMNFFNNWLALRYSGRKRLPRWFEIGRRLEGFHPRGKAPAPALFLTAGVDKQADRCYYVVRAWGEGGTSWLVQWGCVQQRLAEDGRPIPGSDLEQLDDLLVNANFALLGPNALGQTTLPITLICVDSGFEPLLVWNWVRKHPRSRVRAVAGDDSFIGTPYRMTIVEKSARDGKVYPGGMQRWGLDTKSFKADLHGRWACEVDKPGAWLLHAKPLEEAAGYLRQIVNERPQQARDGRGRKKVEWLVIDKRVGNHYLDCEVYALAGAIMLVQNNWANLAGLLKPREPAAAPPPVRGGKSGFVRKLPKRSQGGFIRRR